MGGGNGTAKVCALGGITMSLGTLRRQGGQHLPGLPRHEIFQEKLTVGRRWLSNASSALLSLVSGDGIFWWWRSALRLSGVVSCGATGVFAAPSFRGGLRFGSLARVADGRRIAAGRDDLALVPCLVAVRRLAVVRRFAVVRR